jgi:hypothetical protein
LSLSGFRARLQARADPPQQDMLDVHLPDPDDIAESMQTSSYLISRC